MAGWRGVAERRGMEGMKGWLRIRKDGKNWEGMGRNGKRRIDRVPKSAIHRIENLSTQGVHQGISI
ncbi:MAG: hypothetical protein ACOCW7_00640 [Bacteroidota bacterium]